MRFKKRIPVTLVGGFLGAGKTTLVNWLIESGEKRYGVVVNEFGDVNIDSEIIEELEDGGVAELSGGCLCCVGREDLSGALYGLVCREEPPEHILIELSGLADPVPVAQQLLTTEWRGLLDLDGIVAVADAVNLERTMEEAPEGKAQLAYASVVVLNKVDLAESPQIDEAKKLIEEINPMAEIIKTSRAVVGTGDVVGLGAFSPDWKPRGHKILHAKGINSVALRAEFPLSLEGWVSFHRRMMIRREGIYRAKGILYFEGMDEPMLLQAVRGLYTFETYEGKHDGGSELVVIGKTLDEDEYREAFGRTVAKNVPK